MKSINKISVLLNRKIKEEKLMTGKELAEKLNISPTAVSKWINGGSIEVDKIPNLCYVLNVTPNELFEIYGKEITDEEYQLIESYRLHPEFHKAIKALLKLN